jgi:hypothetical protein
VDAVAVLLAAAAVDDGDGRGAARSLRYNGFLRVGLIGFSLPFHSK